jgi:hypothetical protein
MHFWKRYESLSPANSLAALTMLAFRGQRMSSQNTVISSSRFRGVVTLSSPDVVDDRAENSLAKSSRKSKPTVVIIEDDVNVSERPREPAAVDGDSRRGVRLHPAILEYREGASAQLLRTRRMAAGREWTRAMKAGAVEFPTKPVHHEDLLNAIRLAISQEA